MNLKIKLLGARGSLPTPMHPQILEKRLIERAKSFKASSARSSKEYFDSLPIYMKGGYGGNTICVEVCAGEQKFLIDAGTGIRNVIDPYMKSALGKGQGEMHLFFTHFHWDHVMGLPFFPPLYIKGNKIHLYAVQKELPLMMETLFQKPFFPIPFKALGAEIIFHQLEPRKPLQFKDFQITPYLLDHPDPCWGYKVQSAGKSYAHCVDTEAKRVSPQDLGEDLPLYTDIDLMLFDGQYSVEEASEKVNWGHATAPRGLEIGLREKIKKIIFVHHDPMILDEHIAQTARNALLIYEHQLKSQGSHQLEWEVGYEGMEITL